MSTLPPFDATPLDKDDEQRGKLVVDSVKDTPGRRPGGIFALLLGMPRALWRFIAMNPKMLTGSIIVGFFIVIAIVGPLFIRYDPNRLSTDILLPPSADHWLGTTQTGQDVFAQLMVGTRTSIVWGIITGIAVTIVSIVVGLVSGYFGGVVDEILSVITNIFIVIPPFPLALVAAAYIPFKGPGTIALVILLTHWAGHARALRAQSLSMSRRDFVEAARASGEHTWRLIFLEILPNMLSIVAGGFVSTMLGVILAVAGLEFLGLGDIRNVDWGTMLYWVQNDSAILQGAWWWFVPPGACVALLGAGLTFLNIGIDEISDPRLRSEKKRVKRPRQRQVKASATPAVE